MTRKTVVKLTENFERNLDSIEQFLLQAEASHAFDALLDALDETVIPNLERFQDIGRPFLDKPAYSVEANNGLDALRRRLATMAKDGDLREYLFADYLVLYLCTGDTVYLLSIKHHRQLSFDLQSLWPAS